MLSAQTIKLRLDIPNDQCCKKTFRFRFPFRFFFLPFKITKSQSFGSISFVNIYSYISSYNRRKGMPGLFNCQLTKRFLHSVLCICVETLKKTTPECHTTASHGATCTRENSLVIVWTQITFPGLLSTVYKMRIKWCNCFCVVIFFFFSPRPQTDIYVG